MPESGGVDRVCYNGCALDWASTTQPTTPQHTHTTMANMSYCRFRNTASDLEDCLDHITDEVSKEEHDARQRLIRAAIEIAAEARNNPDLLEDLPEEDEDEEDNG